MEKQISHYGVHISMRGGIDPQGIDYSLDVWPGK